MYLAQTIHCLMLKIWQTEFIPECWKVTKTVPLFKKGNKSQIENYRPISNLCSLAKVFEKLVLCKLDRIACQNNIDITGTLQHGFKKCHSTGTAMIEIQNIISQALDKKKFAALLSIDLSAAFDVVNHELLLERLKIMGLPQKIINLLKSWLLNRKMYVDVNGNCSMFENIIAGTLQGSCLGPILFALFISPVYDKVNCITYADDNYSIGTGSNIDVTIGKVKKKAEILIDWLKMSGMKVNEDKTEFCIFHRNDVQQTSIKIFNNEVFSKSTIKILGVTFDSKLNWSHHVNLTVQKCKKTLQAIKIVSNNFNIDERLNMVTSLFYSKLYYSAEVWLIPTLGRNLKHKLLQISTQALRIAANDIFKIFSTEDLHVMFNRFKPDKWRMYTTLLSLYRITNNQIPESIWIEIQNSAMPATRANKTIFPSQNKLKVGVNSISNRFSYVSTLITNDDLNLSYNAFKVLSKTIIRDL